MKKILALAICLIIPLFVVITCIASASEEHGATPNSATILEATPIEAVNTLSPPPGTQAVASTSQKTESTQAENSEPSSEADPNVFDPYATENDYMIGDYMFDKHPNTDYGKILEEYEYDSDAAGDKKYCNILLPPGYCADYDYPVMYVIHGWDGSHTDQIEPDSYLTLLYGNMLKENLTIPMIIVNVDMYTDKLADKDSKTDEDLRDIYDRVWDDIVYDLMPEIENNFFVKTGRENTALAGVSHGGTEALMTYFQHPEKFGYVASYAADSGVISTNFYEEEYLNRAIFDKVPIPENEPYYLYMAVGTNDEYGTDVTVAYHEELDKYGMKNQTDVVEGYEHDYFFWRLCFYNFLTKIFRN